MDVDEGNLHVLDTGKLSNNYSSTVQTYKYPGSDYGVHNEHYVLHL